MMDFIKLAMAVIGYGIAGPLAGLLIRSHPRLIDIVAFGLVFLTGLHIDTTIIAAGSIDWYRGIAKGYEFTMMEVAAIVLIFATIGGKGNLSVFRALLSPTALLWYFYIFCSLISLISAFDLSYVIMAFVKFSKAWLIGLAIWSYSKSDREIHVVLSAISVMILYQFFWVAKMKWIDGMYQVRGLFEHQNPLAMFTYMAVLPLLSAALSPKVSGRLSLLYLAAFGSGVIIILAALSRAAILFFAVGVLGVVLWSILNRPTIRRMAVVAAMACGGVIVLSATIDTIISRFGDKGNSASGETRTVMNLAALAMVKDKPLGVGWNNFAKAINHPYPYGDVIDAWNLARGQKVDVNYAKGVVESHYYLLLAENGYLGFISYIILIFWIQMSIGFSTLRHWFSMRGALCAGIFVAFLLTYVHSNYERVLTQTKNFSLWMIFIGLATRIAYDRSVKKPEKPIEES